MFRSTKYTWLKRPVEVCIGVSMTPSIRMSKRTASYLMVLTTLMGMTACTYDFDQFDTTAPAKDMSKTDQGDDMMEPDATQDMVDMAPDMPKVKAPFGGACQDDTECFDGGTCWNNTCTTTCEGSDANTCQSGSACIQVNAKDAYCLTTCVGSDRTCAIANRTDLSCATVVQHRDQRTLPVVPICQVDADADGVPDFQDNCPGQLNSNQIDQDGDGQGDACDSEPLCHPDQMMGRVQYPAVAFAAKSFTLPEIVDGLRVPILGNVGADDQATDAMLILERGAKTLTEKKTLYKAFNQQVTSTGFGDFLFSAGQLGTTDRPSGRYHYLRPTDQFDQSFNYNVDLFEPVYGNNRQGDVFVMGYVEDSASGNLVSRLMYYDQSSGTHANITTVNNVKRARWHATQGAGETLLFYSEAQTDANNSNPIMRLITVDRNRSTTARDIALPTPATGVVSPLLLQGRNGNTVVVDRRSGQGWRVDLAQNTLVKEDAYSIPITLLNAQFATLSTGMGFIMVGTVTDDNTKISAVEFNFGCFESAKMLDSDMDAIADLVDTCPNLASDNQVDTDEDGLGDPCDADQDNDGAPNMLDSVPDPNDPNMRLTRALDTDNDGTPNDMDDDDDKDGLTDGVDRFPLDTDNDGLPNVLDTDDDNDGVTDATELAQGTDPHDPLSFRGTGVVAFIKVKGGMRTLHVAPLNQVAQAPEIPLPGVDPYRPALALNSTSVMVLNGQPGTTTTAVWDDMNDMTNNTISVDTGTALRGAVPTASGVLMMGMPAQVTSFIGTHAIEGMRWGISSYNVSNMMWTPHVTTFGEVGAPSLYNTSTVYFAGGPLGCDACQSAFRLSLSNNRVTEQQRDTAGVVAYSRRTGGPLVALTKDDAGVYHLYNNNQKIDLPAGITRVDSIVSLGIGNSLLLSGAPEQGSYDLWWYDGRVQQWRLLLASEDDLVDIDWQRETIVNTRQ